MSNQVLLQEYQVKGILGKRLNHGNLQYLIHWKGFPKSQSSWTQMKYLYEVQDLVKRYQKRHPEPPQQISNYTILSQGCQSREIHNETCQDRIQGQRGEQQTVGQKELSFCFGSSIIGQTDFEKKRAQQKESFINSLILNGDLQLQNNNAQILSLNKNMNRIAMKLRNKESGSKRHKKQQKQQKIQRKNRIYQPRTEPQKRRKINVSKKFIEISDSHQVVEESQGLKLMIESNQIQNKRFSKSKVVAPQKNHNQYQIRSQQFDNLIQSSKNLSNKDDKQLLKKKEESLKNKPKRPLTPFQRYINTKKSLFQNDPNMYQRIKQAYEKESSQVKDKLEKQYKLDCGFYVQAMKKYKFLYNWNTIIDNNIKLFTEDKNNKSSSKKKRKKRGRPARKSQKQIRTQSDNQASDSAGEMGVLLNNKLSQDQGDILQYISVLSRNQPSLPNIEGADKNCMDNSQVSKKSKGQQAVQLNELISINSEQSGKVLNPEQKMIKRVRQLCRLKGSDTDDFLIEIQKTLKVVSMRQMILKYPNKLIEFLQK